MPHMTYRQARAEMFSHVIEARDIRPDGTVLFSWKFPSHQLAGERISPPYDPPWLRQFRVLPDGPWEDVGGRNEDGSWWREGIGPSELCFPAEERLPL